MQSTRPRGPVLTGERIEPCQCGGVIRAGHWSKARPFVEAHNRSLQHMQWRWANGIVTPAFGAPDDPQRHWPTADDEPVDLFQEGDVGASATGAEGAA